MEVPDEVIRELRECLAWLAEHTQQSPQAFDYSGFLRGLPEPPPALLPCPFCGSEAELIRYKPFGFVACTSQECGIRPGIGREDAADAIIRWNTRKESW
jgi:hypothetical protein